MDGRIVNTALHDQLMDEIGEAIKVCAASDGLSRPTVAIRCRTALGFRLALAGQPEVLDRLPYPLGQIVGGWRHGAFASAHRLSR